MSVSSEDLRLQLAALGNAIERARRDIGRLDTPQLATPEPTDPGPAPQRPRRRRLPTVLAIGLLFLGALLVGDAITTVVWQEPFSALYASYEQDRLSGQLAHLEHSLAASPRPRNESINKRMAVLARRLELSTHSGDAIGRITIRSIDASFVMVQGTTTSGLEKGPGHYRGTTLPGVPGTMAIAGHRTTFLAPFRKIDQLKRGELVVLNMPYGRFIYRISGQLRVRPTDVSVLHQRGGGEHLVLTSCDPLFSAAYRRVVVAKLTRVEPSPSVRRAARRT